ncbi:hypothetical protein TWF481_002290 [Arthrobotrys musiformis]|uniref:Uncharacterized protein n=1 Tax=Arthrobotrys musiformis TaxID=47236 RepID=A0AAV9VST1_9PEZI
MSAISFTRTPEISTSSRSDSDGPLSPWDSDSESKEFIPKSKRSARLGHWISRIISKLWLFLVAIFIFLFGFHLGGSVAMSKCEISRENSLLPLNSSSFNLTSTSSYNSSLSTNGTDSLETSLEADPESDSFEEEERLLITYVYFETENARTNALFFIRHGLHAQADFIFILNGKTDIADHIPGAPNIQIIRRNNTCFDLGSHAEVLTANNSTLIKKYNRFIMMNGSIRGPFMPSWSTECWSDAYLSKITETNKLVGMTMRCNADGGKRKVMQSMLFATDRIGLKVLLPVLNHCFPGFYDAVGAEEHSAQTMLDAGYNITVMMSSFMSAPDYAHSCSHGEVLGDNAYFGTSLHPYEMIFQKANRNIFPRQLELLTQWHDQAGYSSWDTCWKKRSGRRYRYGGQTTGARILG